MSDTGQPRTWRDPRLPQQTSTGPQQFAAQGGAPEWRPGSGPVPGGSRVPADFMYDQQPIPQQTAGPPPMTQPYWSIQGAERLRQARQAEQQANVKPDVQQMQLGMQYGVGPVRGQLHLLPQYQQLGNIRPFGPGEFVNRVFSDGKTGWSSEETDVFPYRGKFAVLPTLWMVNGTPMTLDRESVVQYAQQSGLNWPMFNSESEAYRWADQRERRWQQVPDGRSDLQPPLWSRQFPSRQ